MAYTDFTARDLQKKFGVKFSSGNLFPADLEPIAPSDWLKNTLQKAEKVGFRSEKSRSERLVSPVLLEWNELNKNNFSIYSGENLIADASNGLIGECDFLCSFSPIQDFVTSPIFSITEAKKQDLELGIIQCSAQLIGAKIFNQNEESPYTQCIWGSATTGTEWRFLKLENNIITIDKNHYYIAKVEYILATLQYILQSYKI